LLDRKAQSVAYLKRGLAEMEGLCFPQEDAQATRLTYLYPRLVYRESAFGGVSADLFAQAVSAEGIPCSGQSEPLLYEHPLFTEQRFFFESSKRLDYTQVHCPVAEASRAKSIGFSQTVLLSDQAALDDFVLAVNKVKDNLEELRRLA